MSAVVVGWTGRCPDPKDRARLIAHLERLAEVSDSYLRNRLPERVIASSRKSDLREKRQQARANIEFVDGPIAGQVVISSGIVPDHNTFLAAAREAGPAHRRSSRTRARLDHLAARCAAERHRFPPLRSEPASSRRRPAELRLSRDQGCALPRWQARSGRPRQGP